MNFSLQHTSPGYWNIMNSDCQSIGSFINGKQGLRLRLIESLTFEEYEELALFFDELRSSL